jgi:hypothetical protein
LAAARPVCSSHLSSSHARSLGSDKNRDVTAHEVDMKADPGTKVTKRFGSCAARLVVARALVAMQTGTWVTLLDRTGR